MDIQNYVQQNEDGTFQVDKEKFQSELDAEISRAVEKFKNNKGYKEEIRKQLEEEAKLSAEEKLKQEKEDFEKYKLTATIELNQAKAKAKMEGKGFTDKEMAFILSTVSANAEESLAKIEELIAEREQLIADTKKSAIEGLQQGQQKAGTVVVNPDGKGEEKKQNTWNRDDILAQYRPQDKK